MSLKNKSNQIKKTIIETSKKYHLGHIGSCLSCVDILTVLFFKVISPSDRFVLSKGHAAVALYSVLKHKGLLDKIDMDILSEHPDKNVRFGIHASMGSLGQGLPVAVGMAKAGRQTYCLMSDGELDEGSNWEAFRLASYLRLDNLVVIVDANGLQAYKKTDVNSIASKINSFGWAVKEVSGHDVYSLTESFFLNGIQCPVAIVARTIKGKGMGIYENKLASHYVTL